MATMTETTKRMARQAKRAGLDPEKVAPTKSESLRKTFMDEYNRFRPRKA